MGNAKEEKIVVLYMVNLRDIVQTIIIARLIIQRLNAHLMSMIALKTVNTIIIRNNIKKLKQNNKRTILIDLNSKIIKKK